MKFLILSFLFLSGCATYQGKVAPTRDLIKQRQFALAAEKIRPLAEKQDGDQLVHLMDYGTALQLSGDLKASNAIFMKADKLAEQLDYHSVTRQAGSILLNEEMVQYKGDTFEKVFLNAYLAMNFLEMGLLDSALVEARRMNVKFQKYRMDEKKAFEVNVFGKYLSALIWEADRKWDDAYIAFDDVYKLDPNISTIQSDLIRAAKKAQRLEQYKKWKTAFPEVIEDPRWYNRSYGELVILYQQGWGPRKDFADGSHRMPQLRPVWSRTQSLRIDFLETSKAKDLTSVVSQKVYDVESAAMKTLQDDYAALAAKRVAGVVAKEVMADQIRQKNELLGFVAWAAMHATDRADLRQWSLLPQSIQIIRIPLKPGKYKFNLQGLDSSGNPTDDVRTDSEVEIKADRKQFLVFRSVS